VRSIFFIVILQGTFLVTRFSKSRLLLQAGEVEQFSDALAPGKVVAKEQAQGT